MADAASRLVSVAEQLLGAPLPVRVRAWDGSQAGPPGAPVIVVRNRRALRRMLFKPGELGMARAWVAGDLDIEGDLYTALGAMAGLLWEHHDEGGGRSLADTVRDPAARAAVRDLIRLVGPPLPPAPPREEVHRRRHLHTRRTDKRAISHHYDVGNDFYALVLGPSMVYSCAYWEAPETGASLESAQRDKLELVCRKLGLKPGQRLLDVGCGWGSMAVHAAREHGVSVVGITLSQEQAAFARKRVADEGLTDRVEIRVQDYRDVRDGPYDAISSIGMAEHVGAERYLDYARDLFGLLKPGGRLLNHQIARRPQQDETAYEVDAFIDSYVFPDGELAPWAPPSPCWSAPGSRCGTWSRCASTTPAPCAPGSPTWRATGPAPHGSPGSAAPASGGCTWPPPRWPSSATRSASTRSSPSVLRRPAPRASRPAPAPGTPDHASGAPFRSRNGAPRLRPSATRP